MYVVTGGAGFIGSNIVRQLNEAGCDDVLVVDDLSRGDNYRNLCDLRIADYMDRAEFRRELAAGRFAGRVKGISHQGACADTMELDGRYMLDNNFTFSKELLHFALRNGVPMVYASSAAVYGGSTTFNEDPAYEKPLNVYGYSKLLFDQYVRRLTPTPTSTVVGLRYFNVYGPREAHKGRMGSMVYQLYRQLKSTGVARLFQGSGGYADGGQERDFVFVGDVVKVNLFFLQGPARVGVFNCGSGVSRSFNDIAQAIIARLGTGRVEYFPMPESLAGKYQNFTRGQIEQLRGAGFAEAMTSLEAGIAASAPRWDAEAEAPAP